MTENNILSSDKRTPLHVKCLDWLNRKDYTVKKKQKYLKWGKFIQKKIRYLKKGKFILFLNNLQSINTQLTLIVVIVTILQQAPTGCYKPLTTVHEQAC